MRAVVVLAMLILVSPAMAQSPGRFARPPVRSVTFVDITPAPRIAGPMPIADPAAATAPQDWQLKLRMQSPPSRLDRWVQILRSRQLRVQHRFN